MEAIPKKIPEWTIIIGLQTPNYWVLYNEERDAYAIAVGTRCEREAVFWIDTERPLLLCVERLCVPVKVGARAYFIYLEVRDVITLSAAIPTWKVEISREVSDVYRTVTALATNGRRFEVAYQIG